MGACGPVGKVLVSRSEGLGFDSHHWSCVEVPSKLLIPWCLCPPICDWYLVERQFGELWIALAPENALKSPQQRWYCIRESSNTRGVNCEVCWTQGISDYNIHILHFINQTYQFLSKITCVWKREGGGVLKEHVCDMEDARVHHTLILINNSITM